jgi:uncharacterized radical SAM superfamily protein
MTDITFVYPKKTRPLSITGDFCALSCTHCKGHYLGAMSNIFGINHENQNDFESVLVSGGCDLEGAVPLKDHLDLLKKLSKYHKLIAHTGLLKDEDISLVSPFLTVASFNVVGDDSTIKEVYKLDKSSDDFIESYCALRREVNTFPHITIGLHGGKVKGEYNAIDLLSGLKTQAIVLNVLIPTKGTEYENLDPPSLSDVKDVVSYAKKKMNGKGVYLGCMRPGGLYREKLDAFCIKSEIDRIVMPAKSARVLAKNMDLVINESKECCIL